MHPKRHAEETSQLAVPVNECSGSLHFIQPGSTLRDPYLRSLLRAACVHPVPLGQHPRRRLDPVHVRMEMGKAACQTALRRVGLHSIVAPWQLLLSSSCVTARAPGREAGNLSSETLQM